jgi:hypothetical protein
MQGQTIDKVTAILNVTRETLNISTEARIMDEAIIKILMADQSLPVIEDLLRDRGLHDEAEQLLFVMQGGTGL